MSIDKLAARSILLELIKDFTPIQIMDKLVPPALERIGLGWEQGKVALSQIYMSGRICEELADSVLLPIANDRINQPKMAIAALEDYHLMGKRIVYSVLRASGFELLDYGHGIKADELVSRVKEDGIKILLISTLMLRSALQVNYVRKSLNEVCPGIRIVVGGAPFLFDAHLWKEVGADAMGHNASEAISIVSRMMKDIT